jgi:hypothetical protein
MIDKEETEDQKRKIEIEIEIMMDDNKKDIMIITIEEIIEDKTFKKIHIIEIEDKFKE